MIHIYLKREKRNYDNCKYQSGDTHKGNKPLSWVPPLK